MVNKTKDISIKIEIVARIGLTGTRSGNGAGGNNFRNCGNVTNRGNIRGGIL